MLNVKDLAGQTAFYTQILSLDPLPNGKEVILGSGNKPLVHLIQTNREEAVKSSYGLYHMAFNLQSQGSVFSNILLNWTILLLVQLTMVIVKLFIWKTLRAMVLRLYRDKLVNTKVGYS